MKHLVTLAVLALLAASPAHADLVAAEGCAASLGADAKLIYADAKPKAAGGGDLKSIVTEVTKSLVVSGSVPRASAKAAAQAAGACLKKL